MGYLKIDIIWHIHVHVASDIGDSDNSDGISELLTFCDADDDMEFIASDKCHCSWKSSLKITLS